MQQTQTAVQQRKRNLQDYLLSKLRRSRMGATVFLVNGFQIRGEMPGLRLLCGGHLQRRKAADGVQACHLHCGPRAAAVLGGGGPGLTAPCPVSRRRRTRREGAGR